jgi:ABC-type enterobactin transport system permease subunit
MAAACTVRSPNAGDVAIGTSTGVNASVLLGIVKVPSEATPTAIGTGVVNVATSVVLVRIAKLSEMRTGT